MSLAWHARTVEETLAELDSGESGLSAGEVAARRGSHGPNRLRDQSPHPAWRLAVDEARDPLIVILLGAAAMLAAVGLLEEGSERVRDAGLIVAIVILNGGLGFVQNLRARRGMEALQRLSAPQATVVRAGRRERISASNLVPGDVVLLEEGDRVPADGRLIEANALRTDESALTGESLPVSKSSALLPEDTDMAERRNMAYLATIVIRGRGRLVVTAIGAETEVGKIAEAVRGVGEHPSRFEREVALLGRRITGIIVVLIALIVPLQLALAGESVVDTLIAAVALAVAAIPEGLPVVLTLALAFGTRRMLARRVLVRSLPVVEVLGGAEIICTDKTGTVTEGRMSVRCLREPGRSVEVTGEASEPHGDFLVDGHPSDESANLGLLVAGLCNNADRDPDGGYLGDPTEVALLVAAHKGKVDVGAYRRVAEVPFSSERKMMSVVVRDGSGRDLVLAKGAPEVLLDRCTMVRDGSTARPLTSIDRDVLLRLEDELGDQGFRVLGLACADRSADRVDDVERDLVFLALAGLADPPRPAAGAALEAASRAGIRVVMVTGDNLRTAEAIGREIGLAGPGMRGRQLDDLGDDELAEVVESVSVFARVEPTHKLRILQALGAQDRAIAMTGDGVNDAPALKAADVGIAMGVRGTDVARDASDLVLLDDDFASIVAAVEEGRRVFANIRKFLEYLLAGNLAEVAVILAGSLFGYLPITAVQILWVNLVTDSGPAIALAVDPPGPDLMHRPPRRGPILDGRLMARVGAVGAVIAGVVLSSFFLTLSMSGIDTARTVAVTALVSQEFLRIAVIHREERTRQFANRWLVVAVAASAIVQVAALYSPIGGLLDLVPLGPAELAIIAGGLVAGLAGALLSTAILERVLPVNPPADGSGTRAAAG